MSRRCDQNQVNTRAKNTGFLTISWRINIALESYFEKNAKEVWERHGMNLEIQTTLLTTYPPTILKALCEQLNENDQLNAVEEIAGPTPEIPLEYDQNLEKRRRRILG